MPPIPPYPGLRPFNEKEAIFFKGRETHIAKIQQEVLKKRFLMVTGASGDGKSSLIFAGLLPNVHAGFLKGELGRWAVAVFRPGHHPLKNIAEALAPAIKSQSPEIEKQLKYGYSAIINLYKNSELFIDANSERFSSLDEKEQKKTLRKGSNLLIIADQFEEFFTHDSNFNKETALPTMEAQLAMNLLIETARLSREQGIPVYIVCTMRSDYIGNAPAYRGLPELIGDNQFFVPRLNRDEITCVIEEPARLGGTEIKNRLVNRLINDMDTVNTDVLPSLQHALRRIWEYADFGTQSMDLLHYAMAGGMPAEELPDEERKQFEKWLGEKPPHFKKLFQEGGSGISNVLNHHAEILFESACQLDGINLNSEDAQRIIKKIFQCLTQIDDSKAVRNRVTFGDAVEIIHEKEISKDQINQLLKIYRIQGNNFIYPFIEQNHTGNDSNDFLKDDVLLDITHEALIRNWKKLIIWTREEHSASRDFAELNTSVNRWKESGNAKTQLLSQGNYKYFQDRYPGKLPSAAWMRRYISEKLFITDGRAKKQINETAELTYDEEIAISKTRRKLIAGFLISSKKEIDRRKKIKIIAQSVILSLLAIATVGFFWIKQLNENISKTSRSNLLAVKANNILESDPTMAFRLAEMAYKIEPTPLAKQVIMSAYANGPFYKKMTGHTEAVTIIKLVQDEKYILSIGEDKTIRLWEIRTGREILKIDGHHELLTHPNFPNAINISPDGKFIISCGQDSLVRIWDLNGNEIRKLKHRGPVNSAIFSPAKNANGNWEILTASNENQVMVWDLQGNINLKLDHEVKINKAFFSPGGDKIITTGLNKLHIWNHLGNQLHSKDVKDEIIDISVAPSGDKIAYSTSNKMIFIFDYKGNGLGNFMVDDFTSGLTFSKSSSMLASGDNSGKIYLFNLKNKSIIKKQGHAGLIWCSEFSDNEQMILTGSDDGYAKVFDRNLNEILVLKGHSGQVHNTHFSKAGNLVFSCSSDKSIRNWNILPTENNRFAGHGGYVLDIIQDDKFFLTVGLDFTARKWGRNGMEQTKAVHNFYPVFTIDKIDNNKWFTTNYFSEIRILDSNLHLIRKLNSDKILAQAGHSAFDGFKKIFTLNEEGSAVAWDTSGRHLQEFPQINAASFIEKSKFLVLLKDSAIENWNYDASKDTLPFSRKGSLKFKDVNITGMEKSPMENYMAITGYDSTIRVFEINQLNEIEIAKTLFINKSKANLILARFSPDERFLLVILSDNTMLLLDLNGNIVSSFKGHSDAISDANFSADGKLIVSGSSDKSVRIWDLKGTEIMFYGMHKAPIQKCKFTANGRYILTASNDKTACMMPTTIEMVLEKVNKEKVRGDVYELTEEEVRLFGGE